MAKSIEIEKLALSIETAESAELLARLGAALGERFGVRDETPFSILARGEDGALIGAVNGLIHWRWAYVRHLWVAESRRGQGLGGRPDGAVRGEQGKRAPTGGAGGIGEDTLHRVGVAGLVGRGDVVDDEGKDGATVVEG